MLQRCTIVHNQEIKCYFKHSIESVKRNTTSGNDEPTMLYEEIRFNVFKILNDAITNTICIFHHTWSMQMTQFGCTHITDPCETKGFQKKMGEPISLVICHNDDIDISLSTWKLKWYNIVLVSDCSHKLGEALVLHMASSQNNGVRTPFQDLTNSDNTGKYITNSY